MNTRFFPISGLVLAVTLAYGSTGDANAKGSTTQQPASSGDATTIAPAPTQTAPSSAPASTTAQQQPTSQTQSPTQGPSAPDGSGYPQFPTNHVTGSVLGSVTSDGSGGGTGSGVTLGPSPAFAGPTTPLNLALSSPAHQAGTYTGVKATPAFEVSYGRSLARFRKLILEVELPLVFGPARDVESQGAAKSYSSLFFTPSMRLVFAYAVRGDKKDKKPYLPIYPWVSIGGGLAHFSPSPFTSFGAPSGASSTTTGAFQIGGGADILPFKKAIGFRIEARDFYAGNPNLGVQGLTHHNNVVAGAGLVVWFGH